MDDEQGVATILRTHMVPLKKECLNFQAIPPIKIAASRTNCPVEINQLKHEEGISESNWGDNLMYDDGKGVQTSIPGYLATSTYLSS